MSGVSGIAGMIEAMEVTKDIGQRVLNKLEDIDQEPNVNDQVQDEMGEDMEEMEEVVPPSEVIDESEQQTVPIPESPETPDTPQSDEDPENSSSASYEEWREQKGLENVDTLNSECIEISSDGEEIIITRTTSHNYAIWVGRMMGLSEDKINEICTRMGMNAESAQLLPHESCIMSPRMESQNVLRIVGRYLDEEIEEKMKDQRMLMVSTHPIREGPDGCPCKICDSLPDEECKLIRAQPASPRFNSRMDEENGMEHTVVWLVDNVEGQKYVRAIDARLKVFSLFRDTMYPQSMNEENSMMTLTVKPERDPNRMDMVILGGTVYDNVLLVGTGNEEMSSDEDKVNVKVKVKESCDGSKVKVDFIPLIYEDDEVRRQEIRECILDHEHLDECNVFVRADFDYDVRIKNIGSVVADVDLYAVQMPLNGFEEEFGREGPHGFCRNTIYWAVVVLFIALLVRMMYRGTKRRERERRVMSAQAGIEAHMMEADEYDAV